MFKKNSEIKKNVAEAISAHLKYMDGLEKGTPEYDAAVDHLTKLHVLHNSGVMSMDVVGGIVANLAGMLLVINHERAAVIASKAFGMIRKIF